MNQTQRFENPWYNPATPGHGPMYEVSAHPVLRHGDVAVYKVRDQNYIAVKDDKVLTECVTPRGCIWNLKTRGIIPDQTHACFEGHIPSQRVILIACGKEKQEGVHKAKNLYTGQLFQKSRAYADLLGVRWYILSAKHGVLNPEQRVASYDVTLTNMTAGQRAAWSARVMEALMPLVGYPASVMILAGEQYRAGMEQQFAAHRIHTCVPMRGMRIGQQLQHLTALLGDPSGQAPAAVAGGLPPAQLVKEPGARDAD